VAEPTWRQVGGALHDLSRLLLTFDEPDDLLQQIATAACQIVPATTNCSVSLVRDGAVHSVAIANEKARHLDDLQYEHGDGPCLEAIRSAREVLSQDLQTDERWGTSARSWSSTGSGRRWRCRCRSTTVPKGP
jgi:hypothetical protein